VKWFKSENDSRQMNTDVTNKNKTSTPQIWSIVLEKKCLKMLKGWPETINRRTDKMIKRLPIKLGMNSGVPEG
jgi:hypothetical protein